VRATTSAIARLCGGLLLGAALAVPLLGWVAGIAPQATAATLTGRDASGSLQACVAYAYTAISQHKVITATPPACRGLSRTQVNLAASTAIRMTETGGSKAARRQQAGAAAQWARAMITGPAPAPGSSVASPATARPPAGAAPAGGLGLGGVSELAARIGALLAWLATAASGGLVLVRWLLAGGSPLRKTLTAAPPAVILGHVGGGALGLVLWACFMLSGWVALAWIALALLAPVSGLGMGVLLLGLPSPVRPPLGARSPCRRARIPVLAIVAHGLFAVTVLLLVLLTTIGAR
jgi:manganese efflux pump family protein